MAAAGVAPASSWTEYTGYVRGVDTAGTGTACTDPSAPGVMHEDVRYIRPLVVVNYSGAAGTTEVDFFSVERLGGAIGTGDLGDGAATELLEDEYDFAGGTYGTTTARTVTFTPAADCTIEFTATLEGEDIYPDSGNYAGWSYSDGGADVDIAYCPSVSTTYFRHVLSKMFTATGGVTLSLKLKTIKNPSNPSITLWKSYMRVTAVKK